MSENSNCISKQEKKIYTFVDENKLPDYVKLCLKTWHKSIPSGYELVILNRNNILNYISKELLPDTMLQKAACSFPYFFDYISAAVLYSNGGIFLNPDIIMTSNFRPNDILLKNTDLVLFSDGKNNVCSGYMMGRKSSPILEELLRRYRFASYLPLNDSVSKNYIINDIVKDSSSRDILLLDCEDYGYFMEKAMYGVSNKYLYEKYYFTDICSVDEFFENSKGLTALRNSLTPEVFKAMNEKEFLSQNILLSKIFNRIITAQMV